MEERMTFTLSSRATASILALAVTFLVATAGCDKDPGATPTATVKVADDSKRQALLAEQNARIERLLAALREARDETERAALQKELEGAQEAKNKLLGKPGSASSPMTGCTCAPGDTLCTTL